MNQKDVISREIVNEVEKWVASHREAIQEFTSKISNRHLEFEFIPTKEGASYLELLVYLPRNDFDASVGNYSTFSNLELTAPSDVIKILEAVAQGNVEEKITKVFDCAVETIGTLKVGKKELRDHGRALFLNWLLPKLSEPREEVVVYSPW